MNVILAVCAYNILCLRLPATVLFSAAGLCLPRRHALHITHRLPPHSAMPLLPFADMPPFTAAFAFCCLLPATVLLDSWTAVNLPAVLCVGLRLPPRAPFWTASPACRIRYTLPYAWFSAAVSLDLFLRIFLPQLFLAPPNTRSAPNRAFWVHAFAYYIHHGTATALCLLPAVLDANITCTTAVLTRFCCCRRLLDTAAPACRIHRLVLRLRSACCGFMVTARCLPATACAFTAT